MVRALLFDLDGLMVDSEPHSIASWQAVLGRRGARLDDETLRGMFGRRLADTARLLVEKYSLPDDPEALAREKTERQISTLRGAVRAMPGLAELLAETDRRGLARAIATSGVRPYVEAVLEAIALPRSFGVVVTGEEVTRGKPAPDVFLLAARRLGAAPADCLVLEDAPNGVEAAKAAGMRCFAVPNDQTRGLDFSRADRVLASLREVAALLDEA